MIGELRSGSWPLRNRSTQGRAVGKLPAGSPTEDKPTLSAAKPPLRAAQRTLSEVMSVCVPDSHYSWEGLRSISRLDSSAQVSVFYGQTGQNTRSVEATSFRGVVGSEDTGCIPPHPIVTGRRGESPTVGLTSDGSSDRVSNRLTSKHGCWIVHPFFTPFPPIRSVFVSRRKVGRLQVSMDQLSVET